jgi:hypothetical protein
MVAGAGEYQLSFRWKDAPHPGDIPHSVTSLDCYVNQVYCYLTLNVYPDLYDKWQQGELGLVARDILHEVCHTLTEPMAVEMMADAAPSQKEPYRDIIERQTERIAKSIHYAAGEWWPKP